MITDGTIASCRTLRNFPRLTMARRSRKAAIQRSMGKCQRDGQPINFLDETLLRLLHRLEDVRPILEAHDARNMTGDGLIFEGELTGIVYAFYFGKLEVTADNSTFEALPLGLTDADDCVESVIFTLLAI